MHTGKLIRYGGKLPSAGPSAYIADGARLVGDVKLEPGASVWFNAVLRGDGGPIVLGRDSNVQDNCTVHTRLGGKVLIGSNVSIGHNSVIHGCTIGDNVVIGAGTVILDGATVGPNTVVGAGSLILPCTVAGCGLYVGSPAVCKYDYLPPHLVALIYETARRYMAYRDAYIREV
jgi:carbonic anhydrase/acetyltransferase-like protein (isoleucine patch superfamily)